MPNIIRNRAEDGKSFKKKRSKEMVDLFHEKGGKVIMRDKGRNPYYLPHHPAYHFIQVKSINA